jgi:pantothenate synthetase
MALPKMRAEDGLAEAVGRVHALTARELLTARSLNFRVKRLVCDRHYSAESHDRSRIEQATLLSALANKGWPAR